MRGRKEPKPFGEIGIACHRTRKKKKSKTTLVTSRKVPKLVLNRSQKNRLSGAAVIGKNRPVTHY